MPGETGETMKLVVTDLGADRGSGPIFEAITFALRDGEGLLVTGPNGAGKSTLVRAIAGLPLGDCGTVGRRIEMSNLIGDEIGESATILGDQAAHLHHYGKADARPGRKMGHVTKLYF